MVQDAQVMYAGATSKHQLGPPARCPLSSVFGWEGFPTKIDYRKGGTLILTSLLEDLARVDAGESGRIPTF